MTARLKTEPGGRLQPQDWRSGNRFTIVDVVAPAGGAEEMRETVMKMAKKAAGESEAGAAENVEGGKA